MASALDRFRARDRQTGATDVRAQRGVVTTTSAQIDEGEFDDDESVAVASKPGHLPPRPIPSADLPTFLPAAPLAIPTGAAGAGRQDPTFPAIGSGFNGSQSASPAAPVEQPSGPLTAIDRLRERARREQEADTSFANFKKDMAALRTLGRLLEAVYVQPGNASPVSHRMQALLSLTQTSKEMAQALLELVGETRDNGYTRAMAMDAVVGIVSRCWEESKDESQFLSSKPLELLRQAAVSPKVFEAAQEMSHRTWNPVGTIEQHEEALMMASHRVYWDLYMLGEHVAGMDVSRCETAVSRLLSYLQEYSNPRGSSPEMRASWLSASMGRLSSLVCAEIKARFGSDAMVDFGADQDRALGRGQVPGLTPGLTPVTNDALNECVDLAIEGFENVERHAQKLLGGTFVERAASDRQASHDGAADSERAGVGR